MSAALLGRAPVDSRPWQDATYVALDFETTTADARRAVPVSVGWVRVRHGRVICGEAGYSLIRPTVPVPEESIRIHGLLPHALAEAPGAEEVTGDLRSTLDGAVLVAHHAPLEVAVLRRLGIEVPVVVDTLAVVRRLDEREGRHVDARLPAAARRHGLPQLSAHHAYRDALTTALLLLALADRVRGCTVADLVRLSRS